MILPDEKIRTTVVGSYPQPDWLIDREALAKTIVPRVPRADLWRIPQEHLEEAQDAATLAAIKEMEKAGVDIISDGEIRRLLQPIRHISGRCRTKHAWSNRRERRERYITKEHVAGIRLDGVTRVLFKTRNFRQGNGKYLPGNGHLASLGLGKLAWEHAAASLKSNL